VQIKVNALVHDLSCSQRFKRLNKNNTALASAGSNK